ncbi:aminophospholipid-translocating ATPase [Diplocarpon rosae]|nr:aminophospholipid-translocating ATPase [Diplocarpon rosae]
MTGTVGSGIPSSQSHAPELNPSPDDTLSGSSGAAGGAGGIPLEGSSSPPSSLSPPPGVAAPAPSQPRWISPTSATRNRGFSLRRAALALNTARSNHLDQGQNVIELAPQHGSPVPGAIPEKNVDKREDLSQRTIFSDSSDMNNGAKTEKSKHLASSAVIPSTELWSQRKSHAAKFKSACTEVIKIITRTKDLPPSRDGRKIDLEPLRTEELLDERTGKPYIGNRITSSRYTFYNFLPRQIIFQFSRVSNFFFLCIAVLQLTGYSTTGTYSTIVPLMAFVSIAMAKEGYDDYRRHVLDRVENQNTAEVLRVDGAGEQSWNEVKWSQVKVGMVVRLRRDDAIPADLALIYSDGPSGMAYIDTAALDGESNLKAKQASPLLRKSCRSERDLSRCQAHMVVEDPNIDLYNFDGRITIDEETLPLTGNEVIYRGSVLRNTSNAFGMVINTGEECKIRMNAAKTGKAKAPSMQKIVNQIVVIIASFVMVLTGLNVAAYGIWKDKKEDDATYLMGASVGKGELFASAFVMFSTMIPLSLYISLEIVKVGQMYIMGDIRDVRRRDGYTNGAEDEHDQRGAGPGQPCLFASAFVMFSTMIPLSLYISLEIVKVGQMYIMGDIEMYDAETDTPMEPRTNTINEELGQVSHVFSDKTGTLTENIMRFRKMSVAGTAWLHAFDLKKKTDGAREVTTTQSRKTAGGETLFAPGYSKQESDLSSLDKMDSASRDRPSSNARLTRAATRRSTSLYRESSTVVAKHEPTTEELVAYLQRRPEGAFEQKARFFLLAIALCHTALPETHDDGEIDYQAMSPDELALVRAAQDLGFIVVDRASLSITILTRDGGREMRETYEVLDVVEFSSKRKRMSIIIRFPDGKICLFCKGADSAIIKRLKATTGAVQKDAGIRKSMAAIRRSEAQEELRRQSEDQPRSSLSRPSFARSRSSLARHSLVRSRSTAEGRSSIEVFGRTLYDSPRPSIAASRHSFTLNSLMIDQSVAGDDTATLDATLHHIHEFATEGLRTLLYAHRYLDEEEYQSWKKTFHEASTSLINRQEMIDQASESLERDLDLTGATAIEDELQKGVPETIDKLRRAGMRVWMLTGDKRETAINIGHSCKLITSYSEVIVLDHEKGSVEHTMAAALLGIRQGDVAHCVVVVDGQTLSDIEGNESLATLFFELVIAANSVICCRASPTQKAFLVKTIRKKVKGSVTLAIGDSANDIAMIQEAHVGIGISGREGMQAARTSDYSIGQFRFLQRLLLVHGRWNYVRTAKYLLGTFWKEMMFFLTQAIYQGYNGFTGTSLYEYWSGSVINVIFVALCIIFLGTFEQDLQAATLLAVPELYRRGQHNGAFNLLKYFWWNFMALTDAVIIFYFVYLAYGMAKFNDVFTDSSDIFATAAVLLWEVAVESCRVAWFGDEVDVFQELERDPRWRGRFKRIARGEECGEEEKL